MTLQAPNLDSRTFDELVKEARDRIPRFTPDWTNLNDSDPGMTLIKLQAWLTETLLFEVNRLPELNYIKFLQLLNITQKPAVAATAELHFTLKKLEGSNDPLKLFIPKNTQIQADDPDLTTPVIFETDRTLSALNAIVASVIISNEEAMSLVSEYDAKKVVTSYHHSFYPFGKYPDVGNTCLMGILLRPHRKKGVDYSQDIFPSGELDLTVSAAQVFENDVIGNIIQGPLGQQSLLPFEVTEQQSILSWEVYTGNDHSSDFKGTGWQTLTPPVDESAALSRSGHLRPMLPDDISQVSLQQLPRDFWEEMKLKKPPTTAQELIADLTDAELAYDVDKVKGIIWEDIVSENSLNDVLNSCTSTTELASTLTNIASTETLNVASIAYDDWLALEVGYSAPAVPAYAMAWIRIRLLNKDAYQPAVLNGFYMNTVPATAIVTRIEESLGNSDGRPTQQFTLAKNPLYFSPETGAPDIQLDVNETGEPVSWMRVNDFFAADSDATVFRLDVISGVIHFGDGVNGRIPVAGASITVRRYRYGGGDEGNVGANTLSKIKTSLPLVASVTNPRKASGGREAESLEQAKLRAPHDLRTRNRAVTAEDFAFLAKQTPGVPIHTAYALARTALNLPGSDFIDKDGSVTVVILPANTQQATPQPSELQLDAVCKHLDSKRLITTELYVTGPRYLAIQNFTAEVRVLQNADLQAVSESIYARLLTYFDPLKGGEDGLGWPFGEDLYFGDIYELLLDIARVKRITRLNIKLQNQHTDSCQDSLPVPAGHLLHLSADVIDLRVVYDNR